MLSVTNSKLLQLKKIYHNVERNKFNPITIIKIHLTYTFHFLEIPNSWEIKHFTCVGIVAWQIHYKQNLPNSNCYLKVSSLVTWRLTTFWNDCYSISIYSGSAKKLLVNWIRMWQFSSMQTRVYLWTYAYFLEKAPLSKQLPS